MSSVAVVLHFLCYSSVDGGGVSIRVCIILVLFIPHSLVEDRVNDDELIAA